jgi:hypothetical protein
VRCKLDMIDLEIFVSLPHSDLFDAIAPIGRSQRARNLTAIGLAA